MDVNLYWHFQLYFAFFLNGIKNALGSGGKPDSGFWGLEYHYSAASGAMVKIETL
jgi:hypothetical protein